MLHIEHLHKTIGSQTILQDLSLSITDNGVVGLLGPNGAGKSTLMKIIAGLWQFDSGKVEVCGIDMATNPHALAPLIGYLPESNPLYPDLYVKEYLLFMASLSNMKKQAAKQRIKEVIDMVGLAQEQHKKIGELSKGYKQRVGLAQAILADPQLLILDEPTAGFDPNQLDDIYQLIRQLAENRTIILSTHIMQEVAAVCSRAIIINKGQIVEDTNDLSNLPDIFRQKTLTNPS